MYVERQFEKKIIITIKDYDCVIVFISYELYCLFLTIIYKENKTFDTKQIVLKDNHDDIWETLLKILTCDRNSEEIYII